MRGAISAPLPTPVLTRASGVFKLDGDDIFLFGLRAVNALQDDGRMQSLVAGFASMKVHGMQSFVVNFQGGRFEEGGNSDFNGFNANGTLKVAFRDRLGALMDSAVIYRMVPVVQFFYRGRDQELTDDNAVRAAVVNLTSYLSAWQHLWIQAVNEPNHAGYVRTILASGTANFPEIYDSIIATDTDRIAYVESVADAHQP